MTRRQVIGAALLAAALGACGTSELTSSADVEVPRAVDGTAAPFSERGGLALTPPASAFDPGGHVAAPPLSPARQELWIRRSIFITDQIILNDASSGTPSPRFTLRALLRQLAVQAGAGQTEEQLFRQWWDVLNPAPGISGAPGAGSAPHCSDHGNTLNGFPYLCRPAEGAQASPTSPVQLDSFVPIGLSNRFDLAPADGSNCGEYRIIFAMLPAAPLNRNLAIFEAVLPNPAPGLGLAGCAPIQQFWARLVKEQDPAARAIALRSFYFSGVGGAPPVVHVDHYGRHAGRGQIRVNMFRQLNWNLREFQLRNSPACTTPPCRITFVPVTVKSNPAPMLFGPVPAPGHPNAALAPLVLGFQQAFLEQVPRLAIQDIHRFHFEIDDVYNAGNSDSQIDVYGLAPTPATPAFRSAIQAAIPAEAVAAGVTVDHILARAETQSCAGCHQQSSNVLLGGLDPRTGSSMIWPGSASNGFVHVNELSIETGPDGPRFSISPALRDVFLPFRLQIMRDYLASSRLPGSPL